MGKILRVAKMLQESTQCAKRVRHSRGVIKAKCRACASRFQKCEARLFFSVKHLTTRDNELVVVCRHTCHISDAIAISHLKLTQDLRS